MILAIGLQLIGCSCSYILIFAIQENIRKHQIEDTQIDILNDLDVSFPFDGLETEYLQRKYYKKNCNLLVRFDF